MLTPKQEKLRGVLQKHPQLVLPILQDPTLRASIQTEFGDVGTLYIQHLSSNTALLQQVLSDAHDMFTINLVVVTEIFFNVIMQGAGLLDDPVSEEHQELDDPISEEHQEFTGLSSHNNIDEPGAERGFTLLYSSRDTFFGDSGEAYKMDAEKAKNAAPADVIRLKRN